MAGLNNDDSSLANGIPARQIGPETGSSGNATMTNTGGTSEGTNEAADAYPAPASGLGADLPPAGGLNEEERSFRADRAVDAEPFPVDDTETAVQQIADGEDHIDRDKRLSDND